MKSFSKSHMIHPKGPLPGGSSGGEGVRQGPLKPRFPGYLPKLPAEAPHRAPPPGMGKARSEEAQKPPSPTLFKAPTVSVA